jgi:hypothetical protein
MNEFTLIDNILMIERNVTCTLDSRDGDVEIVCARVAFTPISIKLVISKIHIHHLLITG